MDIETIKVNQVLNSINQYSKHFLKCTNRIVMTEKYLVNLNMDQNKLSNLKYRGKKSGLKKINRHLGTCGTIQKNIAYM